MRASVRLPSANRLLDDEGFSVVFCRTEWPYFENFLRESSVRWILTKLGNFVSGPPRANPSGKSLMYVCMYGHLCNDYGGMVTILF